MAEWGTVVNNLIGSLGFPIVCCIALYMQNTKLRESIDSLKEVTQENTLLIKALVDELRKDG